MPQANVHIAINGWDSELSVSSLTLQQAYNRHHVFELVALVPESHRLTVDSLRAILGEQVYIGISTDDGEDGDCHFTGFVDEVVPVWTARSTALRVKGFSPTIFMDCTPRFRCFSEKTLGQILDKIMGGYSGRQRPDMSINGTGDKVPFSVQAQETDFNYLCRLADNHGKMFFYDGQQLHFGKLEGGNNNTVTLDFKRESNHVELSLNLAPLGFRLSGYDLEKSETERYNASQEISNNNPLVGAAMDKSNCYPTQGIHLNHLVGGQNELKATARKIAARQAHELVTLHGMSNNPALKIGSRISIEETDEIMGNGTYIITAVNHQVGSDRSYRNNFTAVPSGYPFPIRMTATRNPVTGPLMAVVKETNDPKKLGRVQVEFIGDSEKALSPWLRVLVPYTKYGGLFFLPEMGEQVVVFHEEFNVEKQPFIMGSFFHGKADAAKWHDPNNRKKGIATEKILFHLDDNTGKLTIEAEEVEIKAKKKMELNGGQEVKISSGRQMNIDGGQRLAQKAGRIDLN